MNDDVIVMYTRDELMRLDVDKIVYFEAEGNYTRIVSKNDFRVLIPGGLTKTEDELTRQLGGRGKMFLRVGKRHIINTRYIKSINIANQSLILTDLDKFAFKISVSKDALRTVKELIIRGEI